ncbi:MAG TPA: SRPBCC family protein [Longimicrobiaceae bacterium]
MTTTDEPTTSPTADREIVVTRLVDAPRELVWRVWTEPGHIAKWWGPNGFTNTIHEMDVRPGGIWRFIMHGPDGVDYPNRVDYQEVVRPERLVYLHGDDGGDESRHFHVTVTFADEGGKTRLTMRSIFATPEARDYVVREFGAIDGAHQTLTRLEEYVAKMR